MTQGDSKAPQCLDLEHHLNHAKVHALTGLSLAKKGFEQNCLPNPNTNTSPQGLIHCPLPWQPWARRLLRAAGRSVLQQTSNSNFYDRDKKVTQCNTPAEFCIPQIKNKSPAWLRLYRRSRC